MSLHFIFLNCTASGMISVARSDMIFQALREINVFYLFMHFHDKIWRAVLTSADEMAVAERLKFSWTDENWVEHSWQWRSYWWPGRRNWDLNVLNSKINDLHLGNSAGSLCNSNEGCGINVTWDAERACVQCVFSIAFPSVVYFKLFYLFIIPLTSWWKLWVTEPSIKLNCI